MIEHRTVEEQIAGLSAATVVPITEAREVPTEDPRRAARRKAFWAFWDAPYDAEITQKQLAALLRVDPGALNIRRVEDGPWHRKIYKKVNVLLWLCEAGQHALCRYENEIRDDYIPF